MNDYDDDGFPIPHLDPPELNDGRYWVGQHEPKLIHMVEELTGRFEDADNLPEDPEQAAWDDIGD